MLQPGQKVGNYTIGSRLGQGGFAIVYEAEHTVLRSSHAIKVLAPELLATEELRSRFLNEGRILAQLRHPNIVRVTDIVVEPNVAGLVMDRVEGVTLGAHLEGNSEGLPISKILGWFRPLLGAVETAHRKGIVHRDLKPDNILLQRDHSDRMRPTVLDFGIAKILDHEAVTRFSTRHGTTMGTPGYMSPEQIQNSKSIDHKADIFALGVILYQAVTGSIPFVGNSEFEVMRATVDRAYDLEILPEQLQALVAEMLSDREHRINSCFEVHERLMTEINGRGSSVGKPTRIQQATETKHATVPRRDNTASEVTSGRQIAERHPRHTPPSATAPPPVLNPRLRTIAGPYQMEVGVRLIAARADLTTFANVAAWKQSAEAFLASAAQYALSQDRELLRLQRQCNEAQTRWSQEGLIKRIFTSSQEVRDLDQQTAQTRTRLRQCRQIQADLRAEVQQAVTTRSEAKQRLAEHALERQELNLAKSAINGEMRNIREAASAANAKVGTGLGDLVFGSPSARAAERKSIRTEKEQALEHKRAQRNSIEAKIRAIKERELWLKKLK